MVNKSHSCPTIYGLSQNIDSKQEQKTSPSDKCSSRPADESYQVFRICKERCKVLNVTIEKGIGITRGKIKDWLYSPDPYVTVQALGTPNGIKRTEHVKDSSDPRWDETLQFYIDPERDRLLEFVLYDLNRTVNEEIGREVYDFHKLVENQEENVGISYKNGSKIEVKLLLIVNPNPSLRFGLNLCDEEERFLYERKLRIFKGIHHLLKDLPAQGPQNPDQCPRTCLMTSGGGFRAMIAYCGAYKAMHDAGIMDTITYISALSGSSWYLSTLYSHPSFPEDKQIAHNIIPELKTAVEKYWQKHLSPPWSSKYLKKIISKSVRGQPVSFTDFFGYLVGQQLLKRRMKAKLSDQQEKIRNGSVPLPLYTCLHVKSNVSAMIFQEWYEFTPFEVGIPKYGVFMKTKDFASKFYMGQKVKSFPEVRLHFLYGIWGSAFTILLKRLVQEKGRNGEKEVLKMVLGEPCPSNSDNTNLSCDTTSSSSQEQQMTTTNKTDLIDKSAKEDFRENECQKLKREAVLFHDEDLIEDEDVYYDTEEDMFTEDLNIGGEPNLKTSEGYEDTMMPFSTGSTPTGTPPDYELYVGSLPKELEKTTDEYLSCDDAEFPSSTAITSFDTIHDQIDSIFETERKKTQYEKALNWRTKINDKCRTISIPKIRPKTRKSNQPLTSQMLQAEKFFHIPKWVKPDRFTTILGDDAIQLEESNEDQSKFGKVLERALTSGPLDSRAFRAGVILNPLRGLTAVENDLSYHERDVPSPVRPTDKIDSGFKGYRESMKTDDKKIYLVDSGLSFNLPFPVALRPQREIELYITFDFSSRKTDATPPFRELLLAEKWASLHNIPFPPIKETVKPIIDSGDHIKEIYVFKDPEKSASEVPVIIFFPLVNHNFRYYKAPGVLRETEEEKAFGDFSIFDGTNDYAIWRFVYPNLSFDRLSKMMEFNVANNLHVIKAELQEIVDKKRNLEDIERASCMI